MNEYPQPVDQLLGLGDLRGHRTWIDYPAKFGLGTEHVADLIRMATDQELNQYNSGKPEVWSSIHALRVPGRLRAVNAVEPLLAMMSTLDENDHYVSSDLHEALGPIGPAAIPASSRFLADPSRQEFDRIAAASALGEIGKTHPEARAECVEILTRQPSKPERGPDAERLNGCIVSSLVDLGAVESTSVIEAAFVAGVVGEGITGNWQYVRYDLGFGPKPSDHRYPWFQSLAAGLAPDPPQSRSQPGQASRKSNRSSRKHGASIGRTILRYNRPGRAARIVHHVLLSYGRDVAKGLARVRFHQQLANLGVSEERLNHGCRIIQPLMERTKMLAMCFKVQRAMIDPFHRVDGVDDVQNREVVKRACQDVTPVETAMRIDEPSLSEGLEHFGQIPAGNLGRGCDLTGGRRPARVATEIDDRAQGVFGSLSDHW